MKPRTETVQYHLDCADKFYKKGEFNNAIVAFNEVIELSPQNASFYIARGCAYMQVDGKLDQGIADFSKAIELDPEIAMAHYNLGYAYFSKGEFDKAIAEYNKVIELDTLYVDAYANRGSIYLAKGELDKAIEDYNHAITLNPKNPLFYCHRAMAYLDKDEDDKARMDYNSVIKLHTNDPQSVQSEYLEQAKDQLVHAFNYETSDLNWLNEKAITHAVESARRKYRAISHHPIFEKSFLWRASKKQIHFKHSDTPKHYAPIFVMGTHHYYVGDNAIDRFDDSIKSIISYVHTVFTEIRSEITYKNVMNVKNINSTTEDAHTDDVIYLFDAMFTAEAVKQKKKLKPLENKKVRKICGSKGTQSLSDALCVVKTMIPDYKNELKNYLANIDDNKISSTSSIDRENFWVSQRILLTSELGQSSLVVPGNAHKLRVLGMLAAEGYTLEPLMKQAPTPKSEIVKFLFYGNSPLNFFKQPPKQIQKQDEKIATNSKQLIMSS